MAQAEADTKGKILDTAEELFSEQGFLNTSLRAITQRAGVNLAAVNYHFGSKDALIFAVFERFVIPMNQERIRLLDEAEATAGNEGPPVEAVARAFLEPVTRNWHHSQMLARRVKLMARAMIELGPKSQELKRHLFGETFLRFLPALTRSVPHLGQTELAWRFYFCIGAMNFAHHARERSGGEEAEFFPALEEEQVPELLLQHMVNTLKAPATLPAGADRDGAEPSRGAPVEGVGR